MLVRIHPSNMYRIAWIYIPTNFSGHGEYCLTREHAQESIRYLNERYPDMDHWIESEEQSTNDMNSNERSQEFNYIHSNANLMANAMINPIIPTTVISTEINIIEEAIQTID